MAVKRVFRVIAIVLIVFAIIILCTLTFLRKVCRISPVSIASHKSNIRLGTARQLEYEASSRNRGFLRAS
jgi:hypothetical protein